METLGAVLGVVILILNFVGVLGLGIAIDHWFLTLVGYIIALGVIANISENIFFIINQNFLRLNNSLNKTILFHSLSSLFSVHLQVLIYQME